MKLVKRLYQTAYWNFYRIYFLVVFLESNGIMCGLVFLVLTLVLNKLLYCHRFLFVLYRDDIGKLCDSQNGCFVILYADDILLISPFVVSLYLEQLLHACECEYVIIIIMFVY